ncbi:hypothetical protein [Chryseobacterium sp. FH1]|uniref:hypothetical protein n=1 Tax=Chryseobacterium sp. FH1 TaxID=1233951 RepID=UPI0004E4406C|nr:hypothetical protein [Chryseobacterium sp. FH1]KFC24348.1 hypothetical protein IO90_03345 [Chryseobacterium sp. FH1]
MFKNYELSKNPMDWVYAILWLVIFGAFAIYIISGRMFEPENGKIHIVAILIGWIAEYIGIIGTGLLFFVIGLYKSFRVAFVKKGETIEAE